MIALEQTLRELALQALALSHKHLATAERYAELCDALEHTADHLYADEQDAAALLAEADMTAAEATPKKEVLTMTGLEPVQMNEIALPYTGELINLDDPQHVAEALHAVRLLRSRLLDAAAILEDVLRAESERQGTKTLHLDGVDAVVSGGQKTEYDWAELADRLRSLGLPDQRLGELIVQTISYRVNQRVAKSVAAANPKYAEALAECSETVPAPWRVTVTTTRKELNQ